MAFDPTSTYIDWQCALLEGMGIDPDKVESATIEIEGGAPPKITVVWVGQEQFAGPPPSASEFRLMPVAVHDVFWCGRGDCSLWADGIQCDHGRRA